MSISSVCLTKSWLNFYNSKDIYINAHSSQTSSVHWNICVSSSRSLSQTTQHINKTQHCKMLPGLISSQAQLCRSNLELMQTIIQAAREVKKVCQKTFADMRWNCSSIDASKFLPDLERGEIQRKIMSKEDLFPVKVSEIYPQMFCLGTASPKFTKGPLSVHCQPLQGNHTPLFIPKCGFHSGLNRSEEPI